MVVILTGITGAMTATDLLRLLRMRDERAAGLAMGLNALATAILIPLLYRLLF